MVSREALEEREEHTLGPCAMRSRNSRGRRHPEHEHAYRTSYQRDRDRIIHSTAFRRLEYKTQLFVNHEGDHYRTRLTHTVEVEQIARSVARALGLNEDLTEAIALAHDLGHTPFGHAGEEALDELMRGRGGFEHNLHGLRVVDELEQRYPDFPGLNLTYEMREAFLKHSTRHDRPAPSKEFGPGFGVLEAQVVSIADEIAYDNHDIDDGLRSRLLSEGELGGVGLWRRAARAVEKEYASLDERIRRAQTVRFLIDMQVTDVIRATERALDEAGVKSPDEAREQRFVRHGPELAEMKKELEQFLLDGFYRHNRVMRMAGDAKKQLKLIFGEYVAHPEFLPSDYKKRACDGLERTVCDYVAGMTDRFVQDEYGRLFAPCGRT
jgi:dGTPase